MAASIPSGTDDGVPVTLITGFLGSGKTTLLNRLLQNPGGERLAVVVNEFGDAGIDGSLVVGSSDDLVELRSGCICCTVRGDLQQTVLRLLKRRTRRLLGRLRFDRLVIEASGLASPGPVLQTFLLDSEVASQTRVDGVITLAHAALIASQIQEHPEASDQLAYADRVLLNHCDRVDDCTPAVQSIRSIRPELPVIECSRAEVEPSSLLDLRTTDPRAWQLEQAHVHGPDCRHSHTTGVRSHTLQTGVSVDLHKLKIWLQHISSRRTHQLLRVKGILRCSEQSSPVVVQGIYQWLELGPGAMPLPEQSRLVLIGQDLDIAELERGWAAVLSS
jgi:G3E family GTPase